MTFERFILIDAPATELFALTQDYSRRLEWDCFLKAAYLLDGAQRAGVGVRANCVSRSGMAMETEYVSFNPPTVTAVKMTRGPWFIENFAGSWRFIEESPGRTKVYFKYSVRARPRWMAPLLSPFLALVFARDTRKRLAALKSAVEAKNTLTPAGY